MLQDHHSPPQPAPPSIPTTFNVNVQVIGRIEVLHTVAGGVADNGEILKLLRVLVTQGEKIMASQTEAAAQLTAANEKLTKVGTETRSLLDKIDALTEAAKNAPVNAELQAALDAVTTQAGVLDDLVPDVSPPAP